MLGVSNAYPKLEMIINVYERVTDKFLYLIRLELKSHYYCNGSANVEDTKIECLEHEDTINESDDKEITIENIVNDQSFQISIKKSLKDTIMEGYEITKN